MNHRIIRSGSNKTAIRIARVVISLGLGWKRCSLAHILLPSSPLSTLLGCNLQYIHCFADTPCNTCNTAGCGNRLHPSLLLGFYTPAGTFYLDAGKYCYLLTHHLRCDGNGTPANKIGAAFTKPKADRSAVYIP